jgi:hypothetical protein
MKRGRLRSKCCISAAFTDSRCSGFLCAGSHRPTPVAICAHTRWRRACAGAMYDVPVGRGGWFTDWITMLFFTGIDGKWQLMQRASS